MSPTVRWNLTAVFAASVAMPASAALAWEPVAGTQELAPRWSAPMVYRLNEDGSDDLDLDVVLAELHAGMLEWTTPDCTSATARYDGLTAELPGTTDEPGADNVIAWRESDWTHGSEAVAVTAPSFIDTGSGEPPEIVAATMWLNGEHWTWVTGPSEARRINLFSVMLHEGGHYWGLGHTLVPMSVMNEEYSQDLTELASDDIEGICSLYPLGQNDDCDAQPCSDGYACVDGNCLWEGGAEASQACDMDGGCDAAEPCDAGACVDDEDGCVVDGDCAGGNERCVAGNCMRLADPPLAMCMRDSGCDAGEACKAGMCVVPDSTGLVGLPVGTECDMDDDCESGMCQLTGEVAQCTDFCATDADCGADARCLRDGERTGLCGPPEQAPEPDSSEAASTERKAKSGRGCSTAGYPGSAPLAWLFLVLWLLCRVRGVQPA